MFNLKIIKPDNTEENLYFTKNIVKIGRHSTNDLVLHDDMASRFHAEVEYYNDQYYIRDVVSKNGVYVNNNQILEHPLNEGDLIKIGGVFMRFFTIPPNSDLSTNIMLINPDETKTPYSTMKEKHVDMGTYTTTEMSFDDIIALKKNETLSDFIKTTYELSKILVTANSIPSLLGEVLTLIENNINFKRAVFMLFDEKGKKLEPVVMRRKDEDTQGDTGIEISKTIVDSCLKGKTAIFCEDAMKDSRFEGSESIFDLNIRSVVCIPLIGSEKDLGILYIEAGNEKNGFSEEETEFLISIANDTCLALENYLLREENFRNEKNAFIHKLFSSFNSYIKETLLNYQNESDNLKCAIEINELPKIKRSFDRIDIQLQKLGDFLKDVEYYSSTQTLNPEKFILKDFLSGFIANLQDLFKDYKIIFNLIHEDEPFEIAVDKAALNKCLMNIAFFVVESLKTVTNPRVEIAAELSEDNFYRIIFIDNSPGMPREYTNNIFEPFFSAKGMKNTGLGLAIAQRLMKACGGSIECESVKNIGTTFIISLPYVKP